MRRASKRWHRRLHALVRYAWAAPNTAVGLVLALAACASGGRLRVVEGVFEAHGGLAAWLLRHCVPLERGAASLTLGHAVIGRDAACLATWREHERVHVAQYERWGPFFVPAYFAATVMAVFSGGHYYRDNRFEREAERASRA